MAFLRLLRSVFATRVNSNAIEKHARRRINFELLEDRLTPAGTYSWIGTTSAAWSVSTNWLGGSMPTAGEDGAVLVFSTATPGFNNVVAGFTSTSDIAGLTNATIQITDASNIGNFTIGGLTLSTGAGGITSNVTVGTGATLSFGTTGIVLAAPQSFTSNAGLLTISAAVSNGGNLLTVNGSANATLSGAVSGAGGITKSGDGRLILSGSNTAYTGLTSVNVGFLNIQNANALGTVAAGTVVATGATLEMQGSFTTLAEPLTLNGTGVTNDGALRSVGGTHTFAGLITLGSAARINAYGTLTLSNGGTIIGGGFALTFGGAGSASVTSAINTSVSAVTKDGTGTLIFGGANSYTCATTIENGVLQVNIDGNLGAVPGSPTPNSILIKAGATLRASAGFTINPNRGIALGPVSGAGSGTIEVTAGTLVYAGALANNTGTGGLVKAGAGALTLSGTNTYTGATAVAAGSLNFAQQVALYNNTPGSWTAANITVARNATLALNVGGAGEFTASDVDAIQVLGGLSTGFLSGSTLALDTTNGAFVTSATTIGDTNGGANIRNFTKLGANELTLGAAKTYTGNTVIAGGSLTSPATLATPANASLSGVNGAILTASATVASGGVLSPGISTAATGILNITGNLSLAGTYQVEINGGATPVAGTDYDRTVVSGTVDLTGSSLVLSGTNAAATTATEDIVLIKNDGASPVTGTFAGLGEGAKIWFNGRLYSITYVYNGTGSDGVNSNDVALHNIATTDYFWDPNGDLAGLGGAGDWQNTTDAFWTTNSSGTATGTYVTWADANATGTARAVFSGTAGAVAVNADVTASYLRFLTSAYILSGNLNFGASSGTVDSAVATTTINANLSGTFTGGAGLTKLAAGTLILGGGNLYTGGTAVNGGVLQISSDGNLGAIPVSATPGNILLNNGTLTTAGTFVLNANRGIALGQPSAPATGTIVVANNTTLTYGGIIANNGAGTGSLIYTLGTSALATLNLSGASTYTGTTSVSGFLNTGPLNISNPDALGSVAGGTTLTGNQGIMKLLGGITVNEPLTMNATNAAPALESTTGTNTWAGNINILTTAGAVFQTAGTLGANLTITGNINVAVTSGTTTIQFAPANVTFNTVTVTGVISGPANVLSGSASSTSSVVLTGLNTYTGQTSTGNATYVFNSIKNVGGGPSALGAPMTVANGTINVAADNANGALKYTGTGDTTDRVINMAGNQGYTTTIEQAGTGLLKFTSNQTATLSSLSLTKTLMLKGSTDGTGEFAGVISNGSNPFGVSVSKTGTGAWTISGNNTYTGPLSITGGTLTISGSNTPSSVTLSGATLNFNHAAALGAGTLNIATTAATIDNTSGAPIVNSNNNPQTWNINFAFTGSNALNLGTGTVDQSTTSKTVTVNASTLTVGGIVSNSGALIKAGNGTLVLSGANTRTGAVTVDAGTLVLSGSNVATGGVITVTGTLRLTNPAALYNADETKWIKTNVIVNNGGTLELNVGGPSDFSTTQAATLLGNLTSTIANNGLRSGAAVAFDTTNAMGAVAYGTTLADSTGTGSGPIGFTKLGTGTLELTATNTYTGVTNVNAGTLLVTGTLADGAAPVDVVVASGATLGGSGGVISGAVSVAAGGTLAPGASIGTLNVNNDLTLAGISSFEVTGGSGPLGASDKVLGINALGYGGTLKITNVGAAFAAGDSWDLFGFTSRFGSFDNTFPTVGDGVNLPSLAGGLVWQFDNDSGVLSIAATLQAPTVTGITPVIGPTTGGTLVTITGANFISITSVTFAGSSPITTFSVTGTTQIDVVTPSHAAGAVDVTVTNSAGSGSLGGSSDFTFYPPTSVDSVVVNGGPGAVLGGSTWSLAGQNSVVKQILVTFNQAVTLASDAFTVTPVPVSLTPGPGVVLVNGGAAPSSAAVTASIAATLSPSSYLVTFSGPGTHAGGGINSGVYDLTTLASKVTANGETMASNRVDTFFAMFGTINANDSLTSGTIGDGFSNAFVDPGSLFQFSDAFGSSAVSPVGPPAYNVIFDSNLDGFIDPGDLFAFSDAFGIDWDF